MKTSEVAAARWLPSDTFRDRRAVVTGGGTGLGLEISRGLCALGADVTILSRNPDNHAPFLEEAGKRGWKASAHAVDVREPDAVHELAQRITKEGAVDILVNNAAGNFVCPAERMSANAWRAVLGIVLDGTFYCTRSFGREMIRSGGGQMLNVVATYAWTGMAGVAHSASAKAGVLALTKSLAAEWARYGIRANAIAPGPFESEGSAGNLWPNDEARAHVEAGIPLKRFGTADEVAAQCLHMLSPACDWMTGECVVLDGGSSLARPFWEPGQRFRRKREAE